MRKQHPLSITIKYLVHIILIALITIAPHSTKIYAQTPSQPAIIFSVETVYFKSNPVIQYIPNSIYIIIDSTIDFEGKISISYLENDQKIPLISDNPFLVIGKRSIGLFIDKKFNTSGDKELIIEIKDLNGTIVSSNLTSKIRVEADNDGDSIPNTTDADDDNDGILDGNETNAGTDPFNVDTDNDGVSDSTDIYPLDPSQSTNQSNNPSNSNTDQSSTQESTTNQQIDSTSNTTNNGQKDSQNNASNTNETTFPNNTTTQKQESHQQNWFEQIFKINSNTEDKTTSSDTNSTAATQTSKSSAKKSTASPDYSIYIIITVITIIMLLILAYARRKKNKD